ncbi:MAG: DUF4328 domain-containing protein [Pseudomonadota bacterium]
MEATTEKSVASDLSNSVAEAARDVSKHAYLEGPRSVIGLSRWAVYGLSAFMIAEFIWIAISAFLIWLFLPSTIAPFSQEQSVIIDYFIAAMGLIHSALFWFSVVLVSRVTYRAMRNLHTFGSKFVEMSPGWAVGWYFVPIANLWQPAKGMSQIYNGTFAAVGESVPGESRIAIWWTCWILSNITANISLRISGFDNMDADIPSFSFDVASSVFGFVSAWALIRLIRPIAEKQELLKHGSFAQVFD